MITIQITTGNAAFEDAGANVEAARILREAANVIEFMEPIGESRLTLRDANGNGVGEMRANWEA